MTVHVRRLRGKIEADPARPRPDRDGLGPRLSLGSVAVIGSIALAIAASLAVGVAGTLVAGALARRSARLATLLAPLTVVAAMGAGLLVGVGLMLLDATVPLLLLAATSSVALAVGAFTALRVQELSSRAAADAERARQQRASELARRELIAGMSHDLRTPLAGIRAMAEALEDGITPDPDACHRGIRAEAQRTAAMVDHLFALASLSGGGPRSGSETVPLGDTLSDLVAHLAPPSPNGGA